MVATRTRNIEEGVRTTIGPSEMPKLNTMLLALKAELASLAKEDPALNGKLQQIQANLENLGVDLWETVKNYAGPAQRIPEIRAALDEALANYAFRRNHWNKPEQTRVIDMRVVGDELKITHNVLPSQSYEFSLIERAVGKVMTMRFPDVKYWVAEHGCFF